MKKTIFLLSLLLTLVFASCQREEPDPEGLFRLTMGTTSPADISMGLHDAEVSINGYSKWVEVNMIGNYDSYTFSDQVFPDWISVDKRADSFKINIEENNTDSAREFTIYFTVKKGVRRQSGSIAVNQGIITEEDMIDTENKAIKNYLWKFEVIDHLPPLSEIQPSSVSPYYKLDEDGTVYMQVVKMGNGATVSTGESVSFRYLRFDLLKFSNDGKLPIGSGNLNTDGEPYKMTLGVTGQYGLGLQLPLQYNLPLGSEVNLVINSSAGPDAEKSAHIPYLYNVVYEK